MLFWNIIWKLEINVLSHSYDIMMKLIGYHNEICLHLQYDITIIIYHINMLNKEININDRGFSQNNIWWQHFSVDMLYKLVDKKRLWSDHYMKNIRDTNHVLSVPLRLLRVHQELAHPGERKRDTRTKHRFHSENNRTDCQRSVTRTIISRAICKFNRSSDSKCNWAPHLKNKTLKSYIEKGKAPTKMKS